MARIKKAQQGVSRASYTTYDPKKKLYTQLDKYKHSDGDRYYRSTSGDLQIVKDMNDMGSYGNAPDSVKSSTLSPRERKAIEQRKGGKTPKVQKNGGSTPAWQRKAGKNPSGGLNAKGVASYRAANPGSKLKTAVTTKPSKLKAGSKAAGRRKSFCSRMSGMKKKLTSAKTANDPNSRINKSLRKWHC
jgi:hypothetical protein